MLAKSATKSQWSEPSLFNVPLYERLEGDDLPLPVFVAMGSHSSQFFGAASLRGTGALLVLASLAVSAPTIGFALGSALLVSKMALFYWIKSILTAKGRPSAKHLFRLEQASTFKSLVEKAIVFVGGPVSFLSVARGFAAARSAAQASALAKVAPEAAKKSI